MAGEEAADVEHPVLRVLMADEVDLDQGRLEHGVHGFQLPGVGQAGDEVGFQAHRGEELIGHDHDGLGQVQGGAVAGGDGDQGVAEGQFVVGQTPVLGPEE